MKPQGGNGSVKVWLSLIIAVAALVLAVRDQDDSAQSTPWETGARSVDSYLQQGLSQGTHHTISKGTDNYADWAEGLKDDVDKAVTSD
jgi:hypothetical protein